MEGILQRYISVSNVGGSFKLIKPTVAEKSFLRGLFKKDFSDFKQVSISLKKFESAFMGTRFEGVTLPDILEAYTGKSLETRIEHNKVEEDMEMAFIKYVMEMTRDLRIGEWVLWSFENKKSGSYKCIINLYRQNISYLKNLIAQISDILYLIEQSEEHVLLPVVAALVTKDPHGLDEGTDLVKLLMYYLSYIQGTLDPKTSEEKTKLLYQGGILDDMGTRLLMTYGLEAYDMEGQLMGWFAFYEREEPLVLSLINLEKVVRLNSVKNSHSNDILIFENPAVFYAVIKANPLVSAICTSGQINLCGYKVLDLLVSSHHKLIYSGDFDPEGLVIAERLKKRYTNNLTFMCYNLKAYYQVISNNKISAKRVQQLKKITDPELLIVANSMKQVRLAGYQEYMIEEIIAFSKLNTKF